MEKIIIDCDCAMGYFGRDIDDGLAILLALKSEELDVLAVTVCNGNVDVDRGIRSAKKVLAAAGRSDIPVFRGADSWRTLGKETAASAYLNKTLSNQPGEVTVVAIAPLTNLATAEKLDPGVLSKSKRIVCMGGAVYGKGLLPPPFSGEFNFMMDAPAAKIVVNAAGNKSSNLTLVPLDLTTKLIFGPSQFNKILKSRSKMAAFLRKNVTSWFYLNHAVTLRPGFWPHDPLAVGFLLRPDLYEIKTELLTVIPAFPKAGCVKKGAGQPVDVCVDVDSEKFLELLVDRLLG